MNIYFKYRQYPNKTFYLDILINGEVIGRLDIVDGGYLQPGNRKPISSIEQAVNKMLFKKCEKLSKYLDKLEDSLHQYQSALENNTLRFVQVDDDLSYPKG